MTIQLDERRGLLKFVSENNIKRETKLTKFLYGDEHNLLVDSGVVGQELV